MGILRTFEYKGKVVQLAALDPEPAARAADSPSFTTAPGAGKFEIGPLSLSAQKIAPGEPVTLSAEIRGSNIAFIYSEILLQDTGLNQFYGPVAREYLQASRNKGIGGVSRPDWEEAFTLTINLTPGLRYLTDGVDFAFGFMLPEGYTSAGYRLDGRYAPVDGTAPRRARIAFDGAGETRNLLSYQELGGRAAPHALTLNQGDQFTPFVQILTPPAGDRSAWQESAGLSTPLTFRGTALRWVAAPLLPGEYRVGLLVQDLDGGFTRQYAPLRVDE
jgi:hypothetical protein